MSSSARILDRDVWQSALITWTFLVAGLAPVVPLLMELPLLDEIPYLNFLLLLPGVLVGTWQYLARPQRIRAIPMIIAIAVMAIGLLWTFPSERGRGLIELALVAVPLPLAVLIGRRADWLRAVAVYLGASSVAAVVLFADWLTSPARAVLGNYRYGALYDENVARIMEPNITATHLAFGVLLVGALWLAPETTNWTRRARLVGTFCVPVLFVGLVLSGSRGGTLTFLGALSVLAAFTSIRRRLTLRTNIIGGLGVVALAALLLLAPNPVSQRIEITSAVNVGSGTGEPAAEDAVSSDVGNSTKSFGGRIDIWKAALDASGSSRAMLLFGAGTGGADHAVAVANPDLMIAKVGEHGVLRANAHTSYLYWLVSFGIIGALIGGVVLAVIALYAFQNDWMRNWGAGLAMLAFFLLTSVTLIAFRLELTSIAVSALTLGYVLPGARQWDQKA